MVNYHARTPLTTFVGPAAATKFAKRGATMLGQLQTLWMADWWRIAQDDFNALARGAALAGVQPRGGAPIELLLRRSTRQNLIAGLLRERTPATEIIAACLTAVGITSLLLVSALNRRDLLEIQGMEPEYVEVLVSYLADQNARLAQR